MTPILIDLIESPQHYLEPYLFTFIAIFFMLLFLQWRYGIINKIIQLTKHLSSSKPFLIALFLSSFLILSFFSSSVLQRFPNSADEYSYLFQAETFLKARLWSNPPSPYSFWFFHIINKDGKWLSKYPPGWPIILSIAMFFHIPPWLVNPLIGTVSLLILFFLAKLLYNNVVGLLSVISVLFSPFFLFNSSSYFSHASCGLLILLTLYCYCSIYIKKTTTIDACWVGICLGAAFLIRPFTALACMVPILIEQSIKKNWRWMLGIIPFLLIHFLYNKLVTGHYLLTPFQWYNPHDTLKFKRLIILDNIKNVENQVFWMNPAIFILYFFTIAFQFLKRKIWVGEILFFILIIFSIFYSMIENFYGCRYCYEAYFLCVLAVIGWLSQLQNRIIGQLISLALIAGLFTNFLIIPVFATSYWNEIHQRNELYRLVEKRNLSNAMVIIPLQGTAMSPLDLARNDPDMQNKVLYALDIRQANPSLLKNFPSRNYYIYVPWEKNDEQKLQLYKIPH